MQNIMAYILAAVVVGVLTFAIFKLKLTGQNVSVSATQFHAAKESSLNVAAMIQRDFTNIGSNFPDFDLPIDSVFVTVDTSGSDQTFSFRGQAEPGETPSLITYHWVEVSTEVVDGASVPVYKLTRSVDGVNMGSSAGGIVQLSLSFQRENGTTVTNIVRTRQIEVKLRLLSSLGKNDVTEGSRWSAVIRPTALQIEPSS